MIQTVADAAAMIAAVGRPNLKLVYDTYHLRMGETGPLTPLADRYVDLIGHVQTGNAPGRHQPGVGEIDLFHIVDHLTAKGWAAPIGLAGDPVGSTLDAIRWAERYGLRARTEALP